MASDNGKRRGFSRRRFIQGAAAAAAASGSMLSSAAREQEHDEEKHGRRRRPSDDAPDTVFINGKIHTMDDENTVASAVSIRDGRSSRSVTCRGAPRTRHEGHRPARPHGGSGDHRQPQPHRADGQPARLQHAARERVLDSRRAGDLRRARRRHPEGRVDHHHRGFHSNHIYGNPNDPLSGRFPTRQELDAAVPNNPAFMMISFSGPGVTKQRRQVHLREPGHHGRRERSMTANNPSRALLYLRQTLLTPESRRRAVIDAMNYAATVGVTTHLDRAPSRRPTPKRGDGARTKTTSRCTFLSSRCTGRARGIVRLRINFLHMESTRPPRARAAAEERPSSSWATTW